MTDRPSTAGSILGATLAGDAGAPGYYPDPSVPGFLRYWAGHAWVPGTSRPAPAPGEALHPPRFVARYLTAPPYSLPPGLVPAAPAAPLVETGPIYLDETAAQALFTMSAHPETAAGPDGDGGGGGNGAGPGAGAGGGVGAGFDGPGELEIRPRSEMEPLRPVEAGPWAVAGNGLRPVAAESWATAAALHIGGSGSGAGTGAVVAPRRGPEVREVEAVVRPLELTGAAPVEELLSEPAPEPEPEPVPRVAQPLGGTPWHGAGGGGSVGLSAAPGALVEPVPQPAEPTSADPASGWRADPQAQRGLMETGGAPRWVSWGVDPEPESEPESESVGAPEPAAASVAAPSPAPAPAPASSAEAQRPGREPRTAHVTSERVRPPRRAAEAREAEARTGAAARRPAAADGAGKRRPAAPAAVPAGVGARAFGWLVDGVVTAVVGAAVAVPMVGTVRAHVQEKIDQAAQAASMTGRQHQVWLLDGTVLGRVGVLLGVLLVFGLLYQVLPIARTGQTFGKRLARVRVVPAGGTGAPGFGRSLVRWLLRGLGTAVLLGPAVALLDRTARRGWHDRAARTRVVRVERG
ncbi:RDD family protein [Kitasatospora sp. NRRL B-11411]|uniref:RDD family protein n=1 Tax=Kitasatospora sp. NRRL B-11411 TaxID=1463822 RepID=UPI0004C3CD29|nr:RDD family protein [Kitasatospora sp. NRRL B-11411]